MELPQSCYRVSAKALIRNSQGEYLLLKERSDDWLLPGGGVEHGEDPSDAVKREVYEELGVKVVWISKQPVLHWIAKSTKFNNYNLCLCYEVEVDCNNFHLPNDVYDAKFFTINEISELNLYETNIPLKIKLIEYKPHH
jgi:8-oxo-dGTP pyrophosphatase MutT (NUDIX family)